MMSNWIGGTFVNRDKKGDKNAREPLTVVFSLALTIIILFVLGGVFGNEASAGPGGGEIRFRNGNSPFRGREIRFRGFDAPDGGLLGLLEAPQIDLRHLGALDPGRRRRAREGAGAQPRIEGVANPVTDQVHAHDDDEDHDHDD